MSARSPACSPARTLLSFPPLFALLQVFLKFGDRRRIASELKIGDIVERHLDREWGRQGRRQGVARVSWLAGGTE